MEYINGRLKAAAGCEIKFKNDLGRLEENGSYICPDFFVECFPAKNIKDLNDMFEEVSLDDKVKHIDECRETLINKE